jgi:hypothetical protein
MTKIAGAYGLYADPVEVAGIVRALNSVGFGNEDICLMFAPTHSFAAIVREAKAFYPDDETSAVSEGLIRWLSEFGAVVIPSLGFFIHSQTFLSALEVARDAPALCGSSRTLNGLGFSATDAKRLETELQAAGFLVYVVSAETARAQFARELLASSGAREAAVLEKENAAEAAA